MEEKEKLMKKGFMNWNKREYYAFIRGCELYGKLDYNAIAAEIGTKSHDEVKLYSDVFWKKGQTRLPDIDRIILNIDRAQSKQNKRKDIMDCLSSKIGEYHDAWSQLHLNYGQIKGKLFTNEEDQFLICMTNQVGYGNWDQLKKEIRKSWQFRFDWFFKSRTPAELQRRVDSLIRLIEKESDQKNHGDKLTGKRSAAPQPPTSVRFNIFGFLLKLVLIIIYLTEQSPKTLIKVTYLNKFLIILSTLKTLIGGKKIRTTLILRDSKFHYKRLSIRILRGICMCPFLLPTVNFCYEKLENFE